MQNRWQKYVFNIQNEAPGYSQSLQFATAYIDGLDIVMLFYQSRDINKNTNNNDNDNDDNKNDSDDRSNNSNNNNDDNTIVLIMVI